MALAVFQGGRLTRRCGEGFGGVPRGKGEGDSLKFPSLDALRAKRGFFPLEPYSPVGFAFVVGTFVWALRSREVHGPVRVEPHAGNSYFRHSLGDGSKSQGGLIPPLLGTQVVPCSSPMRRAARPIICAKNLPFLCWFKNGNF